MTSFFRETLSEASYEGIIFPVSAAKTEGGHGAVEHRAYRRRGADVEPTGLEPYRGTLTIPMVRGLTRYPDLFPGGYFDLISKFEGTPIGMLTHPTKGTFPALIKAWPETLTAENQSGVTLEVSWVEHSGQAAVLLAPDGLAPSDTPTEAQRKADTADEAMLDADADETFTELAPIYEEQLAFLELETRAAGEIAASINVMLSAVARNILLPAFEAVDAYPAYAALVALRATTYKLRDRYLGTRSRARRWTVPSTMSLWQAAHMAYGDARHADLLAASNSLPDPMYVQAGTVLTIPPAS
jgi:prophage DNA circulation protein